MKTSAERKVAVAMSGGVDSSVAAGLLVEQGYQVVGVSLRLWEGANLGPRNCSDHRGAAEVAALLGIPHTVLDHRDDFRRVVVAPFAQSYLEGTTPNPCVACNRNFKIEKLLAWAEDRGIPHVATGHYARIGRRCGNASLLRGSDRNKDQSYFLFALSRRQLERTLFPLGELHKEAVRAKARELGLPVAERPESQDICLEDHRAVVESLARADQLGSGEIVDSRGNVLGHHGGVHGFTVGQRRGLGIAAPRPLYVLRIDAERRRVVVGTREELSTPSFTASRLNWLEPLGQETAAEVQVRYRSKPVPCTLRLLDGQAVEVRPDEPLPSVTPGQAAVFYRDDQVLGGGWIDKARVVPPTSGSGSLPSSVGGATSPVLRERVSPSDPLSLCGRGNVSGSPFLRERVSPSDPLSLWERVGVRVPQAAMRVAIKTLGCKINQYDSAVIQERLAAESCSFVPFEDPADVYVINTCTVTDRADWEARQLVRKARRRNPAARVAVTGCYAQVSPEELSGLPGVDFVVGLNRMDELVRYVTDGGSEAGPAVSVGNPRDERGVGVLGTRSFLGRTRAFLKVQEGCNFACSYCIIPTARGRSRSVPPEGVLEQVRGLAEAGFTEIVLTGIHLGGYGHDLAPRVSLSELVRRIAGSGLIRRLRLSSLDPREVTDELLAVMADSDVICPHLHVCVQAGEDGILKKMRRNYDTAYFGGLMARAREKMPRAALGTDVIVGFPGETEAAFTGSLDFLAGLPLTYFHVFPYSIRRGTPAADMPDQVSPAEKKERSRRARDLGTRKKHEFYRSQVGRRVSVLVEEAVAGEPGGVKGYSRNYLPVLVAGGPDLIHREVRVRLQQWSGGRLRGEVEC